MKTELIEGSSAYKIFSDVGSSIYKGNRYFRGTGLSIEKLLLDTPGAFSRHASNKKFVVLDGNNLVARFALIHDKRLADYIQVSFFEAQKGLGDIFALIKKEIFIHFPNCTKIVVGLNGHLNYGAGILLNRFDEVPLFGLPYNPDYYSGYFKNLHYRKMFTFRFNMETYNAWAKKYSERRVLAGLTVRFMNKHNIKEETSLYTQLNNQSYAKHPYWANRDNDEDLELFYPFRFLLDNENLIFAEIEGKPVGFFLWYPDFNQLVSTQRDLNVLDLIKFRIKRSIDTFRFTEIGIIPQYQGSPVALALISKGLPSMLADGYKHCEGGFIFEENRASIAFVKRILKRINGVDTEPYRHFATFETTLT
jgi:ribosomal protein S18 acetylase RimI-like enzyme